MNANYNFNQKRYELEQLYSILKNQIYLFESQPFKTKQKILKCHLLIKQSLNDLDDYRKKIRGFNYYGFLLGMILFHTIYIFKTKKLLNDMNIPEFKRHCTLTLLTGILFGSLSGYVTASDFRLYLEYSKTRRLINDLNKDFEYYYILNKEQVFDD